MTIHKRSRAGASPTIPVTVTPETVARVTRLVERSGGLLSRATLMRGALLVGLREVERDPSVLFGLSSTSTEQGDGEP